MEKKQVCCLALVTFAESTAPDASDTRLDVKGAMNAPNLW